MIVGSMRLELSLRQARSLKDKRQVAQRILERSRSRFDVAASEVEAADDHRRLVVGFGAVGSDSRVVRATLEKVATFVDELYLAPVVRRDLRVEPFDADDDSWLPSGMD